MNMKRAQNTTPLVAICDTPIQKSLVSNSKFSEPESIIQQSVYLHEKIHHTFGRTRPNIFVFLKILILIFFGVMPILFRRYLTTHRHLPKYLLINNTYHSKRQSCFCTCYQSRNAAAQELAEIGTAAGTTTQSTHAPVRR